MEKIDANRHFGQCRRCFPVGLRQLVPIDRVHDHQTCTLDTIVDLIRGQHGCRKQGRIGDRPDVQMVENSEQHVFVPCVYFFASGYTLHYSARINGLVRQIIDKWRVRTMGTVGAEQVA